MSSESVVDDDDAEEVLDFLPVDSVAESDDELDDELEDDELVDDEPADESSLSACADGMASAAPTPRKTASAPTRPMNLPDPAVPPVPDVSASVSRVGERIESPQSVFYITPTRQV
ncbi:hypothetical protein [Mycobacterium sp. DL]|uniref:hypothetical protein n=1 Tax=Mycobacteriaceae TaxID=1762 RepID=UPI00321A9C3D